MIYETYSQRLKRLNGELPDIYTYEYLPDELRVQIYHIVKETIGDDKSYHRTFARDNYKLIVRQMSKEFSMIQLVDDTHSPNDQILEFILNHYDMNQVIDLVDFTFHIISRALPRMTSSYKEYVNYSIEPLDAVDELNERFKMHGVGLQFENGKLIRLDSTYVHSEIVKPTLKLLSNPKFAGPHEEFLSAHEHYRHGRYRECIMDALKAFESTMKAICKLKKWEYRPTDPAKPLIATMLNKGLIPEYLSTEFNSFNGYFQGLLEAGLPVVRNKTAHGQGATPILVGEEMARYALNLAGSNIIFLVDRSQ
jgi:hypothetical protein